MGVEGSPIRVPGGRRPLRDLRYALGDVRRKVFGLVTTLLAVSLLTFLLTSLLPGDPAVAILGANGVTQESIAAVRKQLDLGHPLPARYLSWLGHAVHGDLGRSYVLNRSVGSQIHARLPITLEIIVLSLVLALVVAIPLGVVTAYKSSSLGDKVASIGTFVGLAVPNFVVGVFLILIFAVHWRLLPPSGWVALSKDPIANLMKRRSIEAALFLAGSSQL